MATEWFENRKLQAGVALFTISLVISGCEPQAPTAPAGLLASAQAQEAGRALFAADCAICHGADGSGRGQRREGMSPPPADLTLPPWSDTASAGSTYLAIREGVRGTAMAGWPMLSDEEIWQLVAHITSLGGPVAPPA